MTFEVGQAKGDTLLPHPDKRLPGASRRTEKTLTPLPGISSAAQALLKFLSAILTTLVLSGAALAQQDKALIIGLAAPMSGPLADAGKAMAAGAQLALRDLAAKGGQHFSLVVENDEASTAGARKAAEALIGKGARIVIGHYTSAATLAAGEVYVRNNVLLMAPSATSPKLAMQSKLNLVRLAAREEAQAVFAGLWLTRAFAAGRIAIVRDTSAQSVILAEAAKAALARAGQKNVGEYLTTGTPPAADAIYLAAGSAPSAAFLKLLRVSDVSAMIVGNDALATPEFAAAAGDGADGIRVIVPIDIKQLASAREAAAQLKSEGVRDITLALSGYAAVQLLAQAVQKTRSSEPAALGQALRGTEPVETIIGPMSFDGNGERLEQLYTIAIWKRAADGKFIFSPE